MKTFKILFAAIIIAGFATSAMAQTNQDTETINANANVLVAMSVNGDRDLEFGDVSPGVNKTIDWNDETNGGIFSINAGAGASIEFSFTTPSELAHTDGTSSGLTISGWDGNWADANDTEEATNSVNFTGANNVTVPSTGDIFIFLGATVEPDNDQVAGSYTAEVTLTAEYN